MSKQQRLVLLTVAALAPLMMLVWLATRTRAPKEPERQRVAAQAAPGSDEGDLLEPAERLAAVSATGAAVEPAGGATTTSTLGLDTLEGQIEALIGALLSADRDATRMDQILDARRMLEHVLRKHPHLAAVVAETLAKMENRNLAFKLGHLMGQFVTRDPAVRAALLANMADGSEVARESSIFGVIGLQGDPEVAGAVARNFLDTERGEAVRATAATALYDMMPSLPPAEQERVRAEARSVIIASTAPDDVRVEAMGLLDVDQNAADRDTVRSLLVPGAAPPKVTLSAAHTLLTHDEDPAQVLPSLEQLATGGTLDPMSARTLQAMLEEHRKGD